MVNRFIDNKATFEQNEARRTAIKADKPTKRKKESYAMTKRQPREQITGFAPNSFAGSGDATVPGTVNMKVKDVLGGMKEVGEHAGSTPIKAAKPPDLSRYQNRVKSQISNDTHKLTR